MQPGKTILAMCPHCGQEKELMSLISGNTFGARQWSDTKMFAPMLPRVSDVQKCRHCGKYFMYREARIRFDESNDSFKFTTVTGKLSYEEMKQAFLMLEDSVGGKESELDLRMAFLHSFNDAFRECMDCYSGDIKDSSQRNETDYELHRSNLNAILSLIDASKDENGIFIAEIYRELGQFDDCISMLDNFKSTSGPVGSIAAQIREKAFLEDDKVFEI